MYLLTDIAAIDYVRRALDELSSVEEVGMLPEPDAIDLRRLVKGFMVEAVVKAYAAAPLHALEGRTAEKGADYTLELNDGVVTIAMKVPTARVLSVKCMDSDYTVSDMVPEGSTEGRKQLNRYVRGTYDDPRLVLLKRWEADHMPRMNYYTTTVKEVGRLDFDIEFLPYPVMEEGVVEIASRMEYAVLNIIVSMVLDSYGQSQAADIYRTKAKEHMES